MLKPKQQNNKIKVSAKYLMFSTKGRIIVMTQRTSTTDWSIIERNKTGAMIDLGYICPHCKLENGGVIFIGVDNVDTIDNGFETDQECDFCGESIIVECR